jgi:hypothetical protein
MFADHSCVVWKAQDAIHREVSDAMNRPNFDDHDTPYEDAFHVRVNSPHDIVFIGNPDYGSRYIKNFNRIFDSIDMVGDDIDSEYEPSEWGLKARYGGWSHVIG